MPQQYAAHVLYVQSPILSPKSRNIFVVILSLLLIYIERKSAIDFNITVQGRTPAVPALPGLVQSIATKAPPRMIFLPLSPNS